MRAVAFALACAVVLAAGLAGCIEEAPLATIEWEVRNESGALIAYTLILEGAGAAKWINATAAPGEVRHHESNVHGVDLMATAQLRDQPQESGGVPFAIDGLCPTHRVTAAWDGQTWSVDAAARMCT